MTASKPLLSLHQAAHQAEATLAYVVQLGESHQSIKSRPEIAVRRVSNGTKPAALRQNLIFVSKICSVCVSKICSVCVVVAQRTKGSYAAF